MNPYQTSSKVVVKMIINDVVKNCTNRFNYLVSKSFNFSESPDSFSNLIYTINSIKV